MTNEAQPLLRQGKSALCPVCKGTGEKLPVVIRNCALVDITCPRCDGTGRA